MGSERGWRRWSYGLRKAKARGLVATGAGQGCPRLYFLLSLSYVLFSFVYFLWRHLGERRQGRPTRTVW